MSKKKSGIRRAAADLERYFATAADLLCIAGDDGYFKYVNAAWERIFGWTPEEMTTHPWQFFVHPDDLQRTIDEATGQLERGLLAIEFDNRYRTKDGRYIWLRWNSSPNSEHGELHAMARDITAQKTAELALNTTNELLAKSNAELEAFTYSAAHDLKEPLRTLEAFSRILLQEYADKLDADGQHYLTRLALASARMKRLIDDLMSISRSGSRHQVVEPVDVNRVIADIAGDIDVTVRERNATIEVQPDLPLVFADPPRVAQVLSNLITNGIKFNVGDAPRVEVGSTVNDGGETVFFVRDNGIGIDPEYHERIFGVFQRLHRREEFEGTGAGLAIVKRALGALGGRIWVESEPGEGTTFLFTLPVSPTAADALQAAA